MRGVAAPAALFACAAGVACGQVRTHGEALRAGRDGAVAIAQAPVDGASIVGPAEGAAPLEAGPSCHFTALAPLALDSGGCAWVFPDEVVNGIPVDPRRVAVQYEDVSGGPRFLVSLGFVAAAGGCDAAPASVYYDDAASPKSIFGCPGVCALHFANDAGAPGGVMEATVGCVGDPGGGVR